MDEYIYIYIYIYIYTCVYVRACMKYNLKYILHAGSKERRGGGLLVVLTAAKRNRAVFEFPLFLIARLFEGLEE